VQLKLLLLVHLFPLFSFFTAEKEEKRRKETGMNAF